jgi:LPS-assembly protein
MLFAAEPTQPVLTGNTTEYDAKTSEAVIRGAAEMRDADGLLTADEIRYNQATDTATATGHVVYTRGALRVLATQVVVHRSTRTFDARQVRVGSYPYYVQGDTATGSRDEVTVTNARVTYGEPGPWQPTVSADRITITAEGRRIRTEGAQVGIGHVQPLPFPKFQQSLSDPLLTFVNLTGGYRGSLGAYIDGGLHVPVLPGVRLGGDLGYYTARGFMAGPSGTYTDPIDPERLRGMFRSGYINDHGDKKTDVLGRPVPENRGFLEWQHQQLLTDDLSLLGQLNWWKDSEVVRDFRPRAFFPVQQPDTFIEATVTTPNAYVSAFARFEPNSFEIVQQRLPEVRYDLMPIAVGAGAYERFNASIAVLRENPLPGVLTGTDATTGYAGTGTPSQASWTTVSPFPAGAATELRSTRFDAYYGLLRPIVPNDWLTITPVAGGRLTHYTDTRGAARDGSYTRTLGEIGVDAELRSSGTFAYRNERWDIDGLRHLFTPKISYRYIPEAQRGQEHIPMIDRQTFSTYLQPLGLGDARNIDELHATDTLRLEFDNTLQTRDPKYGARDLLTFNVADDFRFKRQPGEPDVSAIHTELAAMPTRWLELGMYNTFSPQTFTMRELNTGVTVRDGDAWTVRFANNFLRHQLQDYMVDARARLNEEYDVLAQVRYDQRKHRFTEQAYGIVQNLANTWRISYVVSFYSGRRRESAFGFSVQIDTMRF